MNLSAVVGQINSILNKLSWRWSEVHFSSFITWRPGSRYERWMWPQVWERMRNLAIDAANIFMGSIWIMLTLESILFREFLLVCHGQTHCPVQIGIICVFGSMLWAESDCSKPPLSCHCVVRTRDPGVWAVEARSYTHLQPRNLRGWNLLEKKCFQANV